MVCKEVIPATRLRCAQSACFKDAAAAVVQVTRWNRVQAERARSLTQARCLAASSAAPANVAVCGPPDGHIGCAAAVAGADRLFRRLYPDQGGLLAALAGGAAANGRPEPDDEDSEFEAVGAMASALRRLAADEP